MAGRVHKLILLAACALSSPVFGEPTLEKPASPPPKKLPGAWLAGRKAALDGTPSPEFENVRRALDALTPEQRKRFQENFQRWANLPPEEKKALRDREEVRKNFMQQEVEIVIRESGLQLEGARREEFIKRYAAERRKIEEQLRKETSEKRKPLVHELVARLRSEFSDSATAPAALAPAR
jgi:hypothetical protein